MSFKNAFQCKKCPESNSKNGCPCWLELIMENDAGEKKTEKGCYFQLSPKLMLESVRAANVGSEHACQMRNGFQMLADFAERKLLLEN
jgi:hypothetical protein